VYDFATSTKPRVVLSKKRVLAAYFTIALDIRSACKIMNLEMFRPQHIEPVQEDNGFLH
jgi:hypothetical protein